MHSVHVSVASLSTGSRTAGSAGSIPAQEAARAAAMVRGVDRERFLGARAAVRTRLAGFLEVRAAELQLFHTCPRCGDGDHGRPALRWRGDRLKMNLSYSRAGDWMLLAVSDGLEVGIDAEDAGQHAFGDDGGLDTSALTSHERRALQGLSPDARRLSRARLWTQKEALVKTTGDGLALDPAEIAVRLESGRAEVIRWPTGSARPAGFALADLPSRQIPLPETLVGAVAAATDARVRFTAF